MAVPNVPGFFEQWRPGDRGKRPVRLDPGRQHRGAGLKDGAIPVALPDQRPAGGLTHELHDRWTAVRRDVSRQCDRGVLPRGVSALRRIQENRERNTHLPVVRIRSFFVSLPRSDRSKSNKTKEEGCLNRTSQTFSLFSATI